MSSLADVVVVGGNGGGPFDFIGSAILKKIWVWVGEWQVKGIKVWLTDGQSEQFGQPLGDYKEFLFEDGERFTSLSLWPSQNESRLAAIKFTTNHSREFYARLNSSYIKSEIPVDVASGICVGIKGRSGLDIDRLGFLFINTIKSSELINVVYPTLTDTTPSVTVSEIESKTCKNTTTEIQEYTIESSKKFTQTSSWSVPGKLGLMENLEVKAGIPLLVGTKTNFHLKLGPEGTYASMTEQKVEQLSFPVKVPPGKTVNINIAIGECNIDLPFNCILKITCDNGSVLQIATSGIYKGIAYTGGHVVVNEESDNR